MGQKWGTDRGRERRKREGKKIKKKKRGEGKGRRKIKCGAIDKMQRAIGAVSSETECKFILHYSETCWDHCDYTPHLILF